MRITSITMKGDVLEFVVNYKLYDDKSTLKGEGEAKAVLDKKYLTLVVVVWGANVILLRRHNRNLRLRIQS